MVQPALCRERNAAVKTTLLQFGRTAVTALVAAGMTSGPGILNSILPAALMVQALLPPATPA